MTHTLKSARNLAPIVELHEQDCHENFMSKNPVVELQLGPQDTKESLDGLTISNISHHTNNDNDNDSEIAPGRF